jgi:hypothetical protein
MPSFLAVIRSRLVPAVVTAVGATLVAAGLLSYTASLGSTPPVAPSDGAVPSLPAASGTPTPTVVPSSSPGGGRVATRLTIPALRVDLPVILQPEPDVVPCGVAMYLDSPGFGQPGEPRATYLYAHAQRGMFLPLLERSRMNRGRSMIGMRVQAYTSDDRLFFYEIVEVRRHVPYDSGDVRPLRATTNELWLQTSEGRGRDPKLQVLANPLGNVAADHEAAHPSARPVACG